MTHIPILIDNMICWIEKLIDPVATYAEYKRTRMYNYYYNFFDFVYTHLHDDDLLDVIEDVKDMLGIDDKLLSQLIALREVANPFFKECCDMDNKELLKRSKWEVIKPLAQACIEGLRKLKECQSK